MGHIDDGSARRILTSGACVQQRNLIVMEVKGNLTRDERMAALRRCGAANLKKVARVMIGAPTGGYRDLVLKRVLKEKQEKADAAFKVKRAESKRAKQEAFRIAKLEWARRRAEKEQRQKQRAAQREVQRQVKEAA